MKSVTAAALLTVLPVLSNAQPCDLTAGINSVIRVQANGEGSGVVLDNGDILTAAHVVDTDNQIYVANDTLRVPADLMMIDHHLDVALIRAPYRMASGVKLSGSVPAEYSDIWTVGFPYGGEKGVFNGHMNYESEGLLVTNAFVDTGQSGGALLTCQNGESVLAGVIRGFAAKRTSEGLEPMNHVSISSSAVAIRSVIYNLPLASR
ncbi:MAG: trypsin-like peptidase domain-containing protein [Gammaproteobacteria bacterium]|nr:trypsin-like peptidase domain-containing protein [Gammaproteobacteria bacterium]